MDRTRFSTIAHRDHLFCSPLAGATVDAMIERMALPRGARVLDVGCGKAEMLIRAIERCQGSGIGVDPNAAFLAEARARAEGRVRDDALVLHEARHEDVSHVRGSFDAALCIGATHAFGGYTHALNELGTLVRPGGTIVVGEGYWKQEPTPRYLAALGGTADEFTSHEANAAAGGARGLESRFAIISTEDEWDAYEDAYAESVERFTQEHPDDPDRDAMLERIRAWRAAYLEWGRATLGFGVYGFERRRA